ncbi:HAD family hydrolase [Bernardetia sp. ABR2-2B]|uniref:HAD family hydrolase n=1 Tax=Bernardetia sp. ABR2-2B TaxID=3127472 RepID=UPI0030CE5B10
MTNIKTIVFDLYNTLIEIKEPSNFFLKLFRTSKNGFDLEVKAYLRLIMTVDIDELMDVLPSEFENLYNENRHTLESELRSVVVYEEVIDMLEELKKDFTIFLISNLASPYKEPTFKFGLDKFFDKMIFSSDYGYVKPNQEIFKEIEIIAKNNPNEILMIGDSFKSDIVGANTMGWNYLQIKRDGNILKDYEIQNLTEIRKFI